MNEPLVRCAGCGAHVVSAGACPFCGGRARGLRDLGRAGALALSLGLMATGCAVADAQPAPTPAADAGAPAPDAAPPAPDAAPPPAPKAKTRKLRPREVAPMPLYGIAPLD